MIHSEIRRWFLTRTLCDFSDWYKFQIWSVTGRSPTEVPAIQKRRFLLECLLRNNLSTIVETGTYLGDTAFFFAKRGYSVITIEVEPTLANLAQRRFSHFGNVKAYCGDSAELLPVLLGKLEEPAVFWLDGHYSGGFTGKGSVETPIRAELAVLLDQAKPGSIVAIDDARCFGQDPSYPELTELLAFLAVNPRVSESRVQHDCISFRLDGAVVA